MNILIADDEPDARMILESALSGRGHAVSSAADGSEALSMARTNKPDLIISDILMPSMDGYAFCRELKTDPTLNDVPFIFYTATFVEAADEQLARDLGASRFVVKPTEIERLMGIVDEVLQDAHHGRLDIPTAPLRPLEVIERRYEDRLSRKLAKKLEELQASERRFRHIVQAMPDILITLRLPQLDLTLVSPAVSEVLGFSPQELTSNPQSWRTLIHKDDRVRIIAALEADLAPGNVLMLEGRMRRKRGDYRWFHGRFSLDLESGALIGVINDVSAQRAAEQQLQLTQMAVDRAGDGVYWITRESRLSYANDAACRMLGYTREELVGEPVTLIDPDYPAAAHDEIWHRVDSRQILHFEREHVHKDGRRIPVDITDNYVRMENQTYNFCFVRDITEQRQSHQALERGNRAMSLLSRCNEALVRTSDESELLDEICHIITELGGYPLAWVGFTEAGNTSALHLRVGTGRAHGFFEQIGKDPRLDDPCMKALQLGQTRIVNDLENIPDCPWRTEAMAAGLRSCTALPLTHGQTTLGLLAVYADEKDAFQESEVKVMQEMANDLAFGIQTRRTRLALDRALLQTVEAIARTVEKRDPYTAGHQRRVAHLAVAIAKELGLNEHDQEGIRLGGVVHDIGKIYIPSELLGRPGKLSAVEFELVRSHAQVGYDILRDVDLPWPVADMVLQHHERLDGSGYPQGLRGDQMIPQARIMAVADVVEAIASHRPYRPGLGIDTALQEITDGSGSKFDESVVRACVRLFREQDYQFA